MNMGMQFMSMGTGLVGQGLAGPGIVAIAYMVMKLRRGEVISPNDAVWGWQNRAGAAIIFAILQYIATMIGVCACCIGAVIIAALTSGGYVIIAKDGSAGVMDAFSGSVDKFKPYLWAATGLYFVAAICAGLGVIACGVGIFVSYPIMAVAMANAYLDLDNDGTVQSNTSYTPPAPTPTE